MGLVYFSNRSRLTTDGVALGSVPYMAPEQIQGGEIGPKTDLWACGVMVYEWITGRRPFARKRETEEVAAIIASVFLSYHFSSLPEREECYDEFLSLNWPICCTESSRSKVYFDI